MNIMVTKFLKRFAVIPLITLLAAAPLMCCCFKDVAWAAPTVSAEQPAKGCAHCDKKKQSSVPQNTHECDCPHLLAENGSLKILNTGFPSELSERFSGPSLVSGVWQAERFTAVAKIDKHYFTLQQHNPPPAFLLYHNFRI